MSADPMLQQLKDIHLPLAISMWPIAPGWIVLYSVGLGLLGYGLYLWYQKRQQRLVVKYAKQQLTQLQTLIINNPDNIHIAAEVSALIRRTALYYFKREKIAGLFGEEWLTFLNESGQTLGFTTAEGRLLIDAPYRKHNDSDLTPLFGLTQDWLTTIAKKSRQEK